VLKREIAGLYKPVALVEKKVRFGSLRSNLDYPQVFEIDGEQLWFIDDVSHVPCVLPSDY